MQHSSVLDSNSKRMTKHPASPNSNSNTTTNTKEYDKNMRQPQSKMVIGENRYNCLTSSKRLQKECWKMRDLHEQHMIDLEYAFLTGSRTKESSGGNLGGNSSSKEVKTARDSRIGSTSSNLRLSSSTPTIFYNNSTNAGGFEIKTLPIPISSQTTKMVVNHHNSNSTSMSTVSNSSERMPSSSRSIRRFKSIPSHQVLQDKDDSISFVYSNPNISSSSLPNIQQSRSLPVSKESMCLPSKPFAKGNDKATASIVPNRLIKSFTCLSMSRKNRRLVKEVEKMTRVINNELSSGVGMVGGGDPNQVLEIGYLQGKSSRNLMANI